MRSASAFLRSSARISVNDNRRSFNEINYPPHRNSGIVNIWGRWLPHVMMPRPRWICDMDPGVSSGKDFDMFWKLSLPRLFLVLYWTGLSKSGVTGHDAFWVAQPFYDFPDLSRDRGGICQRDQKNILRIDFEKSHRFLRAGCFVFFHQCIVRVQKNTLFADFQSTSIKNLPLLLILRQ
jgi:hypothetical protein